MVKVYERDPGPTIDGSGAYLGCVMRLDGGWIAEDRRGSRSTHGTEGSARRWLRALADVEGVLGTDRRAA